MDYFKLKEDILTEKLKLIRFQKEKNEAVKNQDFEKAANLRDLEKQSYDKVQELKSAVLEQLSTFDVHEEKLDVYLELQEMLFEFHPIQFRYDNLSHSSLTDINHAVSTYWQIRNEAYFNFKKYIEGEYITLRKEWIDQFKNNDNAVKNTLKQLNHIREFLVRFK
jgi:hypothetical protein